MIPIVYFRSSSFNSDEQCPMQYYMDYILDLPKCKPFKATDMGTITHKVLEVLALIKLAKQKKQNVIKDEICGDINVYTFHINDIIESIFKYYTKQIAYHTWSDFDLVTIKKYVWTAITTNGGAFSPLKRNIVQSELHFDIDIIRDWSKYNYVVNGKQFDGYLGIKGTIDLVTSIDDTFYEIIDWKTGQRKNWGTGERKDYDKFRNDPQLMIYHYALKHIYPQLNHIMITIFYLKDGGPFSISFDNSDLDRTETMLKDKFLKIMHTRVPRLNRSFFCSKFCHFGRQTFENTNWQHQIENRRGQVCKEGSVRTMCEQVLYEIETKGIEKVTEEYINPNNTLGTYAAPGEIK